MRNYLSISFCKTSSTLEVQRNLSKVIMGRTKRKVNNSENATEEITAKKRQISKGETSHAKTAEVNHACLLNTDSSGTTQQMTSKSPSCLKLPQSFYEKDCEQLATALLGKTLARKMKSGDVLKGIIVETEAYLGLEDKAAHSYKGKRTERNEAMFRTPGTVYVYNIYGMYTCINISSKGDGCAVLIRALDPCTESITALTNQRNNARKPSSKSKTFKTKELCNGPSKLTQALDIDKATFNLTHLCGDNSNIWLESGVEVNDTEVIKCPRIGINYAEEWVEKPLRFYVHGNPSVSVKDKAEEEKLKQNNTGKK